MNSISPSNYQILSEDMLIALRSIHETKRSSLWPGHDERMLPSLLPYTFGDGMQPVAVSFYAAPELCIIVLFDSSLPLDHELEERCKEHSDITSFRDATDLFKDLCEDTWSEPPNMPAYRRQNLLDEMEAEEFDDPEFWTLIFRDGCTWCHA